MIERKTADIILHLSYTKAENLDGILLDTLSKKQKRQLMKELGKIDQYEEWKSGERRIQDNINTIDKNSVGYIRFCSGRSFIDFLTSIL